VDLPRSAILKTAAKRALRAVLPLGALLELFTPHELGSGELDFPSTAGKSLPPVPSDEQLRRIAAGAQVPRAPVGIGTPVLEQIRVPSVARLPLPQGQAPAAISSPAPSQAPAPVSRAVGNRISQAMQSPAARNALLALDILTLLNRRSSQTVPRSVGLPSTNPLPDPLTPIQPSGLGSPFIVGTSPSSSANRECDCRTKDRKKRRECKERAEVVWAGGRKKGQKAGTRCVVYRS
jgi:hypothetical protein